MSRRLVALGLACGALLVWGLLFVDPARAPGRGPAEPARAPRAPSAEPENALHVVAASRPAPSAPNARSVAAPAPRPPSPNASTLSVERDRQKMMGVISEARALSERRFAVGSARFARESRQEPWASARETRLRSALAEDGVDRLIDTLECRASVCRVELTAHDSTTGIAVGSARAFQREMGPQFGSGVSGSGLDRRFVLFIAREGGSLDP